jgi:hypothetical protein
MYVEGNLPSVKCLPQQRMPHYTWGSSIYLNHSTTSASTEDVTLGGRFSFYVSGPSFHWIKTLKGLALGIQVQEFKFLILQEGSLYIPGKNIEQASSGNSDPALSSPTLRWAFIPRKAPFSVCTLHRRHPLTLNKEVQYLCQQQKYS